MNFSVGLSIEESGKGRTEFNLDTDLQGNVSLADFLDWTKAALIITSYEVLKDEQSRGFDKTPVIAVDGVVGKSVSNVSPLGQIEFVSRANMTDIIKETFDGIIKRSPILTGRYISSHLVFLNGTQVAQGQNSLDAWLNTNPDFRESDIIRFVNIQPYARKLERLGVTADRQQSRTVKSRDKKRAAQGVRILAPNGAYYLTARSIREKYKRNSKIEFTFITGASLGITGNFKPRGGKPGRTYLYPTIVISVQESGVE